jgi:hypothetical protein
MPLHKGLKRDLVPSRDEPFEELSIGPRPDGPEPDHLVKIDRTRDRSPVGHLVALSAVWKDTVSVPRCPRALQVFLDFQCGRGIERRLLREPAAGEAVAV